MIPEGFITNLLDRADIADVVGRYVRLKKAGRNLTACCPFHKEKTPSFSVSPTKQIYKCFGCGASGNAIGFLMAYEGLEFPDAVRKLAGFYGMVVPEDRSPARARVLERSRTLTDYMSEAAAFYTSELSRSSRAIEYLKNRAILSETARRFALGYSPDEWHSLKGLFGARYEAKELVDVGLVNVKNDRRYDAFRGRIMFPIRNPRGQVIGFGARTMNGDEQPKYLNSPETPIYHKGSELYGLYEAREAIHQKGRAIVCEGYMDVIQLSQAGFTEAVAALGTSITSEHVHKLFKIADTVYFSFDGDAAGRKAARRALEATLPVITDMQKAGFIILPPEHDPDSLIKAEGPQAYEAQIEKAYTLSQFLKHILVEGKELQYADDRAKVVAEARPLVLSMLKAPILQLAVIKEIAGVTRLTSDEIQRQYGLVKPVPAPVRTQSGWSRNSRWRSGFPERTPVVARARVKDIRERMLQCFLAYPVLLNRFSHEIEEEFVGADQGIAQRIVEVWQASTDENGGTIHSCAPLLQQLEHSASYPYYMQLLNEELSIDTPRETATREIRRAFIELELERIKVRIDAAVEEGNFSEEVARPLITRRAELRKALEEVMADEREYRRRIDMQARSQIQEKATGAQKQGAGLVLSDNPLVRSLQEHLFGSAAAAEEEPPQSVRKPAPKQSAPGEVSPAPVSPASEQTTRDFRTALSAKPVGAPPSIANLAPAAAAAGTAASVQKSAWEPLEDTPVPENPWADRSSADNPWADMGSEDTEAAGPLPEDDIPWADPDMADTDPDEDGSWNAAADIDWPDDTEQH